MQTPRRAVVNLGSFAGFAYDDVAIHRSWVGSRESGGSVSCRIIPCSPGHDGDEADPAGASHRPVFFPTSFTVLTDV